MKGIRKDCLIELETLRNKLLEKFPETDARDLHLLLGRLGTFHYNKKNSMLLGREREIYNFLIENSYNPFTVYRWALLEKVPEEIKFQLKNHFLSQKKASRIFFERRHETETTLQCEIRNLGLRLIKEM